LQTGFLAVTGFIGLKKALTFNRETEVNFLIWLVVGGLMGWIARKTLLAVVNLVRRGKAR